MQRERRKRDVRERALAMLARREHGARELQGKLATRGLDAALVAEVIAELRAENLLSDERFTEAWVHSRRSRGYGPLKIESELRSKGIADEVIDKYVDRSVAPWQELARSVWSKKFGGVRPGDYREWTRQARFLQGRGFSIEQIRSALEFDERDDNN